MYSTIMSVRNVIEDEHFVTTCKDSEVKRAFFKETVEKLPIIWQFN